MTAIFAWMLMNVALATALAVAAYLSGWLRRPAVTHALWLLVILRLIAPPLWRVDVSAAMAPPPAELLAKPAPTLPLDPALPATPMEIAPAPMIVEPEPLLPASVDPPLSAAATPWDWTLPLASIWIVGAVICVGLAAYRIGQFRRLLSAARLADAGWRDRVLRLSRTLGMRRRLEVRMTSAVTAPLLWAGFGRPTLLIPSDLAATLDDVQRDALVVHELAHFGRGDHWVRWLEVAATALVWWCPLLWLARRELREAEEQLCDAWVVWALPEARRAYATALVDAVDFVSARRPALPPLASGLGAARNLERRIVMILQMNPPRRLARWLLPLGLGIGLALVSLSPTWADDQPPPPPPPAPPGAPKPVAGPTEPRRDRRMDPAQQEEAAQIRQEMRRLREAMARLENRLAEIEGARPGSAPRADGRGDARAEGRGPRGGPGPEGAPGPMGLSPMGPGGFGGAAGGRFGGMNPPGQFGFGPNFERRLDDMQRAIENLNRQMEEMRRMIGERRGPGRGDGPPNPPPRPPRDDD